MTDHNKNDKLHLSELISDLVSGKIDAKRHEELHKILIEDPKSLEYYIDYITTWALLDECCEDHESESLQDDFYSDIWKALAENEKNANIIEMESKRSTCETLEKANIERVPRKINKVNLTVAILSTAALLFMIAYVSMFPQYTPEDVATLSDTVNVVWGNSSVNYEKGTRLYAYKEPIRFDKGYIRIGFDEGADVVIEGPAEFDISSSSQMLLSYGRLYASVPQQAIGFTVATPNSKIIDLGTEFGVLANFDDTTELHVYKGKTTLTAKRKGLVQGNAVVSEGQARRFETTLGIQDIPLRERAFVRKIYSGNNFVWRGQRTIDLADIVGGGSGFGTGSLNQGIDMLNGASKMFGKSAELVGTNKYISVRSNPYVDGIFVPDGGEGPVIITSGGHVFEDCPDTNGRFWGGTFNGAWHEAQSIKIPKHNLHLGGKVYGTGDNPSIYAHANQGITFDLLKIRNSIHGLTIDRFTANCGISETLLDYSELLKTWDYSNKEWKSIKPEDSWVDFYVLVDGKVRFSKKDISVLNGAIPISVAIYPEDRFLTLITTQGSNDPYGITNDWSLFAEPSLHLNP